MEEVKPNRNLSRWEESKTSRVKPVYVYHILKAWVDFGYFDVDHIGAISRDVARSLEDILETPEGGSVVYFKYDMAFGPSYEQEKLLVKKYGDKIVSIEEMRDSQGYLKQWRVVLKGV